MTKTYLLLVLGLFVSGVMPVAAAPPDMINGMNRAWVYYRNEAEPNQIGAIATHVRLFDASDANGPKVQGELTIWTKRAGGVYDPASKLTYRLPPVTVQNGGTPTRKREHCRWDPTTVLPLPGPGAPQIKIYASLFKGTNKAHGNPNRRLVLRCMKLEGKIPPCDEEPDDDVLQEATTPPDPPPYDDP